MLYLSGTHINASMHYHPLLVPSYYSSRSVSDSAICIIVKILQSAHITFPNTLPSVNSVQSLADFREYVEGLQGWEALRWPPLHGITVSRSHRHNHVQGRRTQICSSSCDSLLSVQGSDQQRRRGRQRCCSWPRSSPCCHCSCLCSPAGSWNGKAKDAKSGSTSIKTRTCQILAVNPKNISIMNNVLELTEWGHWEKSYLHMLSLVQVETLLYSLMFVILI